MSTPVFLHFMSDGKIYVSNDITYTPTGTLTGTMRLLDDGRSQLLCTFNGTNTLTAATGYTKGKYGTEVS